MLEKFYFLILATIFSIWGALMLVQRVRGFLQGRCAEGHAVDWEPSSRVAGFHPVVEFQSGDGSTHRVVGSSSSMDRSAKKPFPVIYLRREPGKAWIYSFSQFWLPPLAPLLMAVFALTMFLQPLSTTGAVSRATLSDQTLAHHDTQSEIASEFPAQATP